MCVCVCVYVCVSVSVCVSVCVCASGAPSCVSVFVRVWGAMLGVLGVSWAAFWALGHRFGGSWGLLGSIFEALGVPCAPFLELWGPNGWLWVSSEAPLAAQGAQSEIFPILFPPIWGSFWDHFPSKKRFKIRCIFWWILEWRFSCFGIDFRTSFGEILKLFWYLLRHCENSKNRTACKREREIEGWVGQTCQQNHKKNASKMDPKTKAKNRPNIDPNWKPI